MNAPPRVPTWVRLILGVLVPRGQREAFLGDMEEEVRRRAPERIAWTREIMGAISLRFDPHQAPRGPGRKEASGWHSIIWFDLRMAGRKLGKSPLFSGASVATLTLGIGAVTTMFSLVHSVLLRPLPFPESDRLVSIFRLTPEFTGMNPPISSLAALEGVPLSLLRDWEENGRVLESAGGYATRTVRLRDGDRRVSVGGAIVTSGVLRSLGVQPALGRLFLHEHDAIGVSSQVIISHALWQGRFGGDRGVLGTQLVLNEVPHTVVGVMPPEMRYPRDRTDAWLLMDDERKAQLSRQGGNLQVIARLRPGFSIAQAQAEMDALARRLGEEHPAEAEHGVLLVALKDLTTSNVRGGLLLLFGAVALVLLIACANIANLFLLRSSERRRELGVHQALGASAWRLASQHLSEVFLLVIMGGVLGCLLAVLGQELFLNLYPDRLPRTSEVGLDLRFFLIAAGVSCLAALLVGTLPAYRATKVSVNEALAEGGRGSSGSRGRNRLLNGVAVAEISLAFLLLAGAGLFVRSLVGLLAVDPGFSVENKLTMTVSLPARYREPAAAEALFLELNEQLASVPGVESVGHATHVPLVGWISDPPTSVETAQGEVRGAHMANSVSPSYFSTLGIPLLEGRLFTPDDRAGGEPVALVNAAMARRYWPEENAIGRRVRLDLPTDSVWRTVVGVVGDVRHLVEVEPFPEYYLPFFQAPGPNAWYQVMVVAFDQEPGVVAPAALQALRDVDPDLPTSMRLIEEGIQGSRMVRNARFLILVLGGLAGLAGILAVLGVYAVLAFAVQQRSHEIGIRLALGAGKGRVLKEVMGRGMAVGSIGLAAGVSLALVGGRAIESLLFGVSPSDPKTLAAIGLLVAASILGASYFPARRATSVDPVEALKGE